MNFLKQKVFSTQQGLSVSNRVTLLDRLDNQVFEQELNLLHQEIILNIPFSNFSRLYSLDNKQLPIEQFGGDCIELSSVMLERVSSLGLGKASFIKNILPGGTHHAVLIENGKHIYFSDPALQIEKIIDISFLPGKHTINCYPTYLNNIKRKAEVTIERQDNILKLTKKYHIGKGVKVENFEFDLNADFDQKPLPQKYKNNYYYNSHENKLIYRLLTDNGQKQIFVTYPFSRKTEQETVNKNLLAIKMDDSGEKIKSGDLLFDHFLAIAAKQVKLSKKDFLDYLLEGIELYYKYMPEGFEFNK